MNYETAQMHKQRIEGGCLGDDEVQPVAERDPIIPWRICIKHSPNHTTNDDLRELTHVCEVFEKICKIIENNRRRLLDNRFLAKARNFKRRLEMLNYNLLQEGVLIHDVLPWFDSKYGHEIGLINEVVLRDPSPRTRFRSSVFYKDLLEDD